MRTVITLLAHTCAPARKDIYWQDYFPQVSSPSDKALLPHVILDDGTEGSGAVFDGTCTEMNECLDTANPVCAVNQICQNTIGSYTCYCKPQFVDDGAGNCVNRDECQEGVCPISGVSGLVLKLGLYGTQ